MPDTEGSKERQSMYFGLSLQNIISLVVLLGAIGGGWAHVTSRIEASASRLEAHEKWITAMQGQVTETRSKVDRISGQLDHH